MNIETQVQSLFDQTLNRYGSAIDELKTARGAMAVVENADHLRYLDELRAHGEGLNSSVEENQNALEIQIARNQAEEEVLEKLAAVREARDLCMSAASIMHYTPDEERWKIAAPALRRLGFELADEVTFD
jgi:hypothetical protein